MEVIPVACLKDNYAYLVHTGDGHDRADGHGRADGHRPVDAHGTVRPRCVVVDPSEAGPVLQALEQHGLELAAILNTHHHWDHVGGNEALCARLPGLKVYGHASDQGRIPAQTEFLEHGARFSEVGLDFSVLHIPGHTRGALAYRAENVVFTGDTLFVAGCGRLFEGTPGDMYRSLNEVLREVPDETLVYCGHEYTLKNLGFARGIEPDNDAIDALEQRARARLDRGEPSVPFSMGDERAVNPFLRCSEPAVRAKLGLVNAPVVEVLAAVRRARDTF